MKPDTNNRRKTGGFANIRKLTCYKRTSKKSYKMDSKDEFLCGKNFFITIHSFSSEYIFALDFFSYPSCLKKNENKTTR